MKYFIPSYEQALKIVKSNPEMTFYKTEHTVDGYSIHTFSYKLAWYKEFINPVDGEDWTAHEMRGLTFVFDKDGSLYNRHILLNKFWNVNQNEETLLSNLIDKEVKAIHDKLDGSIASFVRLPNGKVYGKSKASFSSDQSIQMTELYNSDSNIKRFVDWSLDNNLVAIFEYVSPLNKIVLDYDKSKLVLLKLRNNLTGEYIDISSLDENILSGIELAKTEESISLDKLLEISESLEGKEGWVVQFSDGYIVKIKTKWYFSRHRLLTESLNRENDVIELIVNEKIDDVVSQLGDTEVDVAKKEWISAIQVKVNKYLSNKIADVNRKFKDYDENRLAFVLKYKKDEDFSLLMKLADGKDAYDTVSEFLLNKTKHLMAAKKFLEKEKI